MSILEFYDFESKYYDLLYSSFLDDLMFIRKYGFKPRYCELFSGTGRISALLPDSCGVEINLNMILHGKRYNAILGDVRYLPLKGGFNSILIPLNSLNLLDKDDRLLVLREARRALSNEGKIYVEIMNGMPFKLDEELVLAEAKYDHSLIRVYLKLIREQNQYLLSYRYEIKGKSKLMKLRIFEISYGEFTEEVLSAGLEITDIYGGYNFEKFDNKCDRIIAILGKQKL